MNSTCMPDLSGARESFKELKGNNSPLHGFQSSNRSPTTADVEFSIVSCFVDGRYEKNPTGENSLGNESETLIFLGSM